MLCMYFVARHCLEGGMGDVGLAWIFTLCARTEARSSFRHGRKIHFTAAVRERWRSTQNTPTTPYTPESPTDSQLEHVTFCARYEASTQVIWHIR